MRGEEASGPGELVLVPPRSQAHRGIVSASGGPPQVPRRCRQLLGSLLLWTHIPARKTNIGLVFHRRSKCYSGAITFRRGRLLRDEAAGQQAAIGRPGLVIDQPGVRQLPAQLWGWGPVRLGLGG